MKGYKLSTDYEKLWKLIHDGYRIAGWVKNDRFETPIFDVIEIKSKDDFHFIGSRGIGYNSYEHTLKSFKETCEFFEIKYIEPTGL